MKIVVIGAGSQSFGRGQVADALRAPELKGRGVTLALVDEDPAALATMTSLAERIRQHVGTDITIEAATDRTDLLGGADYVITAVARRRWELWEQDFRIPLAYGMRHCLGENGGPYIENLPRDGVVEVPAVVDASGVHPQKVGALPEPFAALIRTQFSIIALLTEAYRTRSKRLLLQALLLDPTVHSVAAAEAMLDDMLALQKAYLPEFS